MKNNTSKIALIILSLALLVGAAIGVSVSAETAAPEIVSKNINVTGNYCLMLAVDPATVAGDDVTITIYEQLPAEGVEPAQTITKAKTATEKIDLDHDGTAEYDAIVFYTAGVPQAHRHAEGIQQCRHLVVAGPGAGIVDTAAGGTDAAAAQTNTDAVEGVGVALFHNEKKRLFSRRKTWVFQRFLNKFRFSRF